VLLPAGGGFLLLCCCGIGGGAWFFSGKGSVLGGKPDYLPLRVGSRWEYDFELQVDVLPVQKGTATRRIDGEEKIDGKSYSRCVTVYTGVPGMDSDTQYLRAGDDGYYSLAKS
jgi:hypothetical protein